MIWFGFEDAQPEQGRVSGTARMATLTHGTTAAVLLVIAALRLI